MEVTEIMKEAIFTSEDGKRIINDYNNGLYQFTLNSIDSSSIKYEKFGAEICLRVNCTFNKKGLIIEKIKDFYFRIGHITPKGYFSTKKIKVDVLDSEFLTYDELTQLMAYFNPTTKEITFDPFYFENNEARKQANAWAFIATKLQPDCRN